MFQGTKLTRTDKALCDHLLQDVLGGWLRDPVIVFSGYTVDQWEVDHLFTDSDPATNPRIRPNLHFKQFAFWRSQCLNLNYVRRSVSQPKLSGCSYASCIPQENLSAVAARALPNFDLEKLKETCEDKSTVNRYCVTTSEGDTLSPYERVLQDIHSSLMKKSANVSLMERGQQRQVDDRDFYYSILRLPRMLDEVVETHKDALNCVFDKVIEMDNICILRALLKIMPLDKVAERCRCFQTCSGNVRNYFKAIDRELSSPETPLATVHKI